MDTKSVERNLKQTHDVHGKKEVIHKKQHTKAILDPAQARSKISLSILATLSRVGAISVAGHCTIVCKDALVGRSEYVPLARGIFDGLSQSISRDELLLAAGEIRLLFQPRDVVRHALHDALAELNHDRLIVDRKQVVEPALAIMRYIHVDPRHVIGMKEREIDMMIERKLGMDGPPS